MKMFLFGAVIAAIMLSGYVDISIDLSKVNDNAKRASEQANKHLKKTFGSFNKEDLGF